MYVAYMYHCVGNDCVCVGNTRESFGQSGSGSVGFVLLTAVVSVSLLAGCAGYIKARQRGRFLCSNVTNDTIYLRTKCCFVHSLFAKINAKRIRVLPYALNSIAAPHSRFFFLRCELCVRACLLGGRRRSVSTASSCWRTAGLSAIRSRETPTAFRSCCSWYVRKL